MMSTVSTRGVKFKFSEGERVLCYEPDPTKAKVLYESKVLDLYVGRDERGRKVPEYLIHFFGWNNSWDRYVREEFILPYTEENCELQAKLASEAALTIKGKRKIKLPPLIKETLAKKLCLEEDAQKVEKPESPIHSSSSTDSSDDETDKEIILDIPSALKEILVEDWKYINNKNKFAKLPCKPNVISILEAFVRHFAGKLLCVSPPKNAKNGKQEMPEDVEDKLNLCKETMDGLRVYFDFTLPHLLLYRQEKKQYQTEGMTCSPQSCSYKWEPKDSLDNVVIKVEKLENETPIKSTKFFSVPVVKVEPESMPLSRTPGKKSLRSRCASPSSGPKQEGLTNGEADKKPTESEAVKKEEKTKKSPKERPRPTVTRILRSTEKQKTQQPEKEDPVPKPTTNINSPPPVLTEEAKRSSPVCPTLTISLEHTTNLHRVTRKSTLQNMSPPRISSPTFSSQSSQPSSTAECKDAPVSSSSAFRTVVPASSNGIGSSDSSSHSTLSNLAANHPFHLVNNELLLQDILSWRMLPARQYEVCPAAPSLLYGSQHLLRLFVKLPEMLAKMNLTKKKIPLLLEILNSLLQFLTEKKSELFHASAYCDGHQEIDVCSVK